MNDKRMKDALVNIARHGVPENTNLWPNISARLERKSPMTTLRTRPFVAALIALFVLLALSGAAYALGRVFGYIPGVGLVENNNGMRVLTKPASVTREGVTLTVTQALVYSDHVQLIYEISGIAPENDNSTMTDPSIDQTAFCGPASSSRNGYLSDGDAQLLLPDGTVVERAFDTSKYPENIFAMKPTYEVAIPPDITELTMVLKCIPWARLGAVPENWEVPLKLKYVPAGTVIGEPVLNVTPSVTSSVHENGITVTLDKVVPQADLTSFYFTIVPDEKKDSMLALYPASANMIDSTGQKISLVYMHPYTGSHDMAEPWELQSVAKPAHGPYTLTLDKVFTYYSEDGSHYFDFDTGTNPQVGQTWPIDQVLHLAGTDIKVVSAKMVEKDLTSWGLSANTQGFEFNFEAVDGKTPFLLDIMDRDLDRIMAGTIIPFSENGEPATQVITTLFYEKGIPAGKVSVAVNGQTTMTTGNWQLQWKSPDQTGVNLLDVSNAISSQPGVSDVTAELTRVVKLDEGYLFYVHMTLPGQNPDFRVVSPVKAYVIDSAGQKINLHLDGPQVYAANDKNIWQFSTGKHIASGPLKVVIEKAEAHYNAFDWSIPPSHEILAAHSFTFDAGTDPQVGQTWPLDAEFELGDYKGKVISARAVTIDAQLLPFPELRPDRTINSGYEFTIQSLDPTIQWNVMVSLARPEGSQDFVDCIGYLAGEASFTTTHTVTCRGLPNSVMQATIQEISILLDDNWQIDWALPTD